jgi:CRISPR/Cas system-associated endonuclease Cas1
LQSNPKGLDEPAFRAWLKEQSLAWIDQKLRSISSVKSGCEQRELMEEVTRQAAAVLPSPEVLDKLMRYETTLERQLYRAMNQLERVQRRRQGENIPAPLTMEVSERP